MNVIDVTANERISKLLEEVLVKLSCLLSELDNGSKGVVDNVTMVKDETNVVDEMDITIKPETTQNKECLVISNDEEEIKSCDEHSFVSCSFKL